MAYGCEIIDLSTSFKRADHCNGRTNYRPCQWRFVELLMATKGNYGNNLLYSLRFK